MNGRETRARLVQIVLVLACVAALSGCCSLTFGRQPDKDMHVVRVESFEPKCCKKRRAALAKLVVRAVYLNVCNGASGHGKFTRERERERERNKSVEQRRESKSGCCVSQLVNVLVAP